MSGENSQGGEADALREQLAVLRREIAIKDAALHRKNVELDALHFVWCDGGCEAGTHRFTHGELTEEIVAAAERNTRRLRRRLNNRRSRLEAA